MSCIFLLRKFRQSDSHATKTCEGTTNASKKYAESLKQPLSQRSHHPISRHTSHITSHESVRKKRYNREGQGEGRGEGRRQTTAPDARGVGAVPTGPGGAAYHSTEKAAHPTPFHHLSGTYCAG